MVKRHSHHHQTEIMMMVRHHHQMMMIMMHHRHHQKKKKNHHHHHQGMEMMLKIWMNTNQLQHSSSNSINIYHNHQCSRCHHPR